MRKTKTHSPRCNRQHAPSARSDMSYATSGMVDMGRMAVGGAVMIGTIGAVGSLFKK